MYQFTTETIINSNLDSNGVSTKFSGANNIFKVLRVGNFKKENVVSVFKTGYVAPVKEKLLTPISVLPTTGKVYRLNIVLKKDGSNTADFANDMSYNSKTMPYEVLATSAMSTTTHLTAAFVAAIKKTATIVDNVIITASSTTNNLVLEVIDEYQRFVSVEVQEVISASLTGYDSFTVLQDVLATGSLTRGKEGMGTVKQITKNLRLPTLANTSWTALYQDERPVAGGQYTQYSLRLKTDMGDTGMSVVGQSVHSITTHVFYVLSTLVSDFDTALANAGITVQAGVPGANSFKLDYVDYVIAVGDKANPTVTGGTGAITFASGTVGTATVVAGTGVVTGVATGTTVITATDAAGSTATFTMTVIA